MIINTAKTFFLFSFIQIFVLNEIVFSSYITPLIYVCIILSLPKGTNVFSLYLISFISGCIIDIFEGQIGYHSTACVLLAFLKEKVLSLLSNSKNLNNDESIRMNNLGTMQFLVYISLTVFFHCLILFLVSDFELNNFFRLFSKIVMSSLSTVVLIFLSELFYKKQNER